jgi:pimeloyl-ACP methyl ester carboxylesterase
VGDGPGLLVVHGSMQAGLSQHDLADLLAPGRTVHLLDRRGRGLSGPYPAGGVDPATEVADVVTVARTTGTTDVLGISSGAILTLRAALATSDIERIALFEPPIGVDGSIRPDLLDRFDREYASGALPDAMVTAMRAAEMGPAVLRFVPRRMLRAGTRRMLRRDDARAPMEGQPSLRELATALPADLAIVRQSDGRVGDFADIAAGAVVLAGTRTRPYLRVAADALGRVLPNARTVPLPGTDHGVTQNRQWRGRPELVAPTLVKFFA